MDVTGADRALCQEVAKTYLSCVAGYEAKNSAGLSDAEIRGDCLDVVNKKYGKKHKNLWKNEPLGYGRGFSSKGCVKDAAKAAIASTPVVLLLASNPGGWLVWGITEGTTCLVGGTFP